MNAERLHAIVQALRTDLRATNALGLLEQIVGALQNQINQPNQAQFQQQVSQQRQALRTALANSKVNEFSPTWKQAIEEIGEPDLLGTALDDRIEKIFARNGITPSVAHKELGELHAKLKSLSAALDQIASGFHRLKIGAEQLGAGTCEVGVLLPRTLVDNQLMKLADELLEQNQILGVFHELVLGSRPAVPIRTIASSDFSVFLEVAPQVGACLAIAVERIVTLYRQLLEIRKLHGELTKQGLEKESLEGVERHANSLMENGIKAISKELLGECSNNADGGRKNELEIEVRIALKKIANRIDRGVNIEVRMDAPDSPSEDDADAAAGTSEMDAFQKIRDAAPTLTFLKVEGQPILSLPESEANKNRKKD